MITTTRYHNVLYVTKQPLFLAVSPWDNLCLGIVRPEMADADRVRIVCEMLGLQRILELCKEQHFEAAAADSTDITAQISVFGVERDGLAGVTNLGPGEWLHHASDIIHLID